MVEHLLCKQGVSGSSPLFSTHSSIAQLVEQVTVNHPVPGSSPGGGVYNLIPMDTYTIEYWQENWDELMTRVEEGETIGITDGKNNAVMVPYEEYLDKVNEIGEMNVQ